MSEAAFFEAGAETSLPAAEGDAWGLVVAALLIALNGFFVAAEFALVRLRPMQLEARVKRGQTRARLMQHMLRHIDSYLSASQLGITLASLALGWIGEPAFSWVLSPLLGSIPHLSHELARSITLTTAFVTITALHIVIGEQGPKVLAIRRTEKTALWVAIPFYLFHAVAFPLIWLLNRVADRLLALVGVPPGSVHEVGHTEDELRALVSSGAAGLSPQKGELVRGVLELSRRTARQAMVPRSEVVWLSTADSIEENLALIRSSPHTRFPLCHGELDRMIGMVHIKDVFRDAAPPESLEAVCRPMPYVPETLTLDRLLRRLRVHQHQMAAVVDEYGGVSGIVTLENVLEAIVGPIYDEFDTHRSEIELLDDGRYRMAGRVPIGEIEDRLGVDLDGRTEETVAGMVLSELGRAPALGDRVTVGRLVLDVVEARGRRIQTLEVRVLSEPAETIERPSP